MIVYAHLKNECLDSRSVSTLDVLDVTLLASSVGVMLSFSLLVPGPKQAAVAVTWAQSLPADRSDAVVASAAQS